jgi:predicted chitinase
MLNFILSLFKSLFGGSSNASSVTSPPGPPPLQIPEPQVASTIAYMLTMDQLRVIMPALPLPKADEYLPFLQSAMNEAQINTRLRVAAFLAQLAHESYQLKYMEEEASGAEYEGRKDLGNTQPGDGPRYKGRGPIQLTGRSNYTTYGAALGLDLVDNPEQAAMPQVGFRVAGLYWTKKGLNALADVQDFVTITKKINGGLLGLAQRQAFYDKALSVLS